MKIVMVHVLTKKGGTTFYMPATKVFVVHVQSTSCVVAAKEDNSQVTHS